MKRLATGVMVCSLTLLFYIGLYGLARWRKCIVMREWNEKERHLVVRKTGLGVETRDDWKGRLKSTLNPILFTVFQPLALVEDRLRGGSRPVGFPADNN